MSAPITIPNLINGISQQPAPLRLASQLEEQENAYSSVVEGLRKRPPTEALAKLTSTFPTAAFVHLINRDVNERYVLVVTEGDLKVYDLAGAEQTVAFPDGKGYLTVGPVDPFKFRAVTVADFTFLINQERSTSMQTDLTAAGAEGWLVFVKRGEYSQDYNIYLNGAGSPTATYTTPDAVTTQVDEDDNQATSGTTSNPISSTSSNADNIQTDNIAAQLKSAFDAATTGYTVTRQGSVLHITKDDSATFDLTVTDSFGNQSLFTYKDKVQKFTDLPTVAPDTFILEVIGDQTNTFDNYYVKFAADDGTFSHGVWEECAAPAIPHKMTKSTMPHSLIREADGTFTFQRTVWGDRGAGDETSSEDPSFIGKTISDIFFYKNRLGLLADDNVILSRAGDFFNFWRETATAQLDTDPIDVSASHTKVSILRSAIPFDKDLILFSDLSQFSMPGGDLLTPKTASLPPLTEYESALEVKPVSSGKTLFFAVPKEEYTGIREYFVDPNNETKEAAEITAHVPKFIPKNVTSMAASSNEDLLVVLSSEEPGTLFVYKYYWAGPEKLQSSWSKWTFGADAIVLGMGFIENTLYLVIQYPDGVWLEKIVLASERFDAGAEYLTHLDRRLNGEGSVFRSYNAATNETTLTLPYEASADTVVVTRATVPASSPPGKVLVQRTASATSPNEVVVVGDHTNTALWIGTSYTMLARFSTPYLRQQNQGGGTVAIESGRTQLIYMTVVCEKTGFFKAVVYPALKEAATHKFSGRKLGSGFSLLGEPGLITGSFRFPVFAENTQQVIDLINDSHMPSAFQSAEYEVRYTARVNRR